MRKLRVKFTEEYDEDIILKAEFDIVSVEDITEVPRATTPSPKGFAVISYTIRCKFRPEGKVVVYELFYSDKAEGNIRLTRQQAVETIVLNDLKLVVDNVHGKVWE